MLGGISSWSLDVSRTSSASKESLIANASGHEAIAAKIAKRVPVDSAI
jgi:hypothetical protein